MQAAANDLNLAEKQDAVADMFIFMMHYCTLMDIDVGEVYAIRVSSADSTPVMIGRLAHHHLKKAQGIRGSQAEHHAAIKEALAHLVQRLREEFDGAPDLFVNLVEATWEEVRGRDWVKHRAEKADQGASQPHPTAEGPEDAQGGAGGSKGPSAGSQAVSEETMRDLIDAARWAADRGWGVGVQRHRVRSVTMSAVEGG